jgi:hypothetical protein
MLWIDLTYSLLANINVYCIGHSDSVKGRKFIDFMTTICLSRKIILHGISWFWKTQYNVDSDAIYIRCVEGTKFTEMVLFNVIFRQVPKSLVKNDYYLLHVRPSISPSVCLEQRDSQQTNFCEILYLSSLLNFFPTFHFYLTTGKNNTVLGDLCTFIVHHHYKSL